VGKAGAALQNKQTIKREVGKMNPAMETQDPAHHGIQPEE